MGVEYELKYSATEAQQDMLLSLADQWQTIAMETTYYDTPTLALSAVRFTLRRRLENGVSICTVKTPAPGNCRGEWETQCDDILSAIPVLCKLGAPKELEEITTDGVIAICGARFQRRAAQITHGSSVLEIALDHGQLFSGSHSIPLCEVEVELKSGDPADAIAFAGAIASRCGLQAEAASKFRRALNLYKEGQTHGTA